MFRDRALPTLFLVSTVVVAFEVALTRICSVLLKYHVSFAVVSMAVLGLGLGGFLGYALARRDSERAAGLARLGIVTLAPAILAALATLLRLPFARHWPLLLFLVLPVFVAAGLFQSLLLRARAERIGPLYAADLAGGALGALLAVVGLDVLGGPVNAALVLAVLAAGTAWMWTRGAGRAGRLAPALLVLACGAVGVQRAVGGLDVRWERAPDKLLTQLMRARPEGTPHLVPELARWDAYSRVDVLELATLGGVQRQVFIDGETPTPMLAADPVAPNAAGVPMRESLAALAFRLQPPRRLLSIGSGGGYDVVLGRSFGAREVDAVELNAGVLHVVEAARRFTGDVYRQPGVRLHHAEGRLFVRRAAPGGYDAIVMALAQSLAGNLREYALSENYLYTRQAFEDYLRALRPDGTLALLVSSAPVRDKLLRTALEVLEARGADAAACVAALSSPRESPYDHLVLVRATPFPPALRAALGEEVERRGYAVRHLPAGIRPGAPTQTPASLDGGGRLHLEPASDDRPFFFNLERRAPGALRLLLGITLALLVVALGALGLRLRRPAAGDATPGRGPALRAAVYFVTLGLAFMMVEVLVLQKSIRIIGFPTLNLGLVLAVFLVAAGSGSAASPRLHGRGALRLALVGLAAGLVFLVPLLDALESPLERLPLAARCVALGLLLFPFGFAMGLPFPTGVRLLPAAARGLIPWYWGLNGVASIVGSALVIAVVLEVGFTRAALLPAALYLLAPWLAPASAGSPRAERRPS
jgi:protein-L-isoaspartate O-methyltransferase